MKNKFKNKIRESKSYESFRKIKFSMHLIPWWNWFLKFFKHYFGGLYIRFDTHHIFLFAGGLSFSLFVCIIPFVLIIFWILGNFLSSAEVEGQIVTLINTVIPYDEYSNFVKDIIFKRVYEVIEFKNIAGLLGFIGLFFAASGFFSSMRTVLNKINGTDIDVNVFLGKLRDFLFIISVILLFFISIMALPLLELFISIAQETPYLQFFAHPIFQRVFTALFSLLIMYFIFYAFYRFIPTIKIRSNSAFVGAGWAALLWVGMKILFGYYLSNFGTWGKIYGAYALVVVIAFWIYYTSAVFIIGAEIGKLFDERLTDRISKKNLIAVSDSSK